MEQTKNGLELNLNARIFATAIDQSIGSIKNHKIVIEIHLNNLADISGF